MVQWLGLSAFTAGAQVPSLVGEPRSRKPVRCGCKKKERNFVFLERVKTFLTLIVAQPCNDCLRHSLSWGYLGKIGKQSSFNLLGYPSLAVYLLEKLRLLSYKISCILNFADCVVSFLWPMNLL